MLPLLHSKLSPKFKQTNVHVVVFSAPRVVLASVSMFFLLPGLKVPPLLQNCTGFPSVAFRLWMDLLDQLCLALRSEADSSAASYHRYHLEHPLTSTARLPRVKAKLRIIVLAWCRNAQRADFFLCV